MMRPLLVLVAAFSLLDGCSRPRDFPVAPHSAPEAERPADAPRGPLPAELAPFRAAFDRSELSYVAITATKESGTAPWRSKFRGVPYFPKGQPYPRDAHGKPLMLLAQVNFAEMPPLPDYPTQGMVQFFVSGEESREHIYGALQYNEQPFNAGRRFDSMLDQRFFRVLYHARVVPDMAGQGKPEAPDMSSASLPIWNEAALHFETRAEAVSLQDYRFEKFLGKPAGDFFGKFLEKESAVADGYQAYAGNWPLAKIGGYTNVIQDDPRASKPDEDWVILLEIRSGGGSDNVDVMWGDDGVGAFFIRRADLRRRDFSKVAYYWDNH